MSRALAEAPFSISPLGENTTNLLGNEVQLYQVQSLLRNLLPVFPQLLIVLLFLPVRLSDGRISISSPFRDFWQISHDVISVDPQQRTACSYQSGSICNTLNYLWISAIDIIPYLW